MPFTIDRAAYEFPSPYGEEVLKVHTFVAGTGVGKSALFPSPYGEEVLKVGGKVESPINGSQKFPSPYGEEVLKVAQADYMEGYNKGLAVSVPLRGRGFER